jgi:hypothetical protein
VFNKEGEVVAICAQPPRAVAVDRELIGSLWERGQGKQWIAEYAAPAPAVKP